MKILWEGPLQTRSSLALINREICKRLIEAGHEVTIRRRGEGKEAPPFDSGFEAVAARIKMQPLGPFDIVVRHQWPPDFSRPDSGRLVIYQHWEFGRLPKAWIQPLNEVVDELWVATAWVKDCCVASGVDASRVQIVAPGVDPLRFHPEVRRFPLPSKKSFKFLFVGGTIERKGIHQLLDAWSRAFSARDDVSLIIKDLGSRTFYRGQTAVEAIRRAMARPGGPEIIHLDEDLADSDLPGLYAAADALVHPFLGEGFGLPIAEAMATARPVVITDFGAPRDFCDASCGFLVPAKEAFYPENLIGDLETAGRPFLAAPDVEVLARLLRAVSQRPEEATRRAHRARERIRTRYTWEHTLAALQQRLASILQAPARTAGIATKALVADPPTRAALRDPEGEPIRVRWGAPVFDYSGYARVSRMLLPAIDAAGVDLQVQPYGADAGFVKDVTRSPEATACWNRRMAHRVRTGLYVCVHPPTTLGGINIFSCFRRQNAGFDGYVGFTMFETDRLPSGWVEECKAMDQVWVPSSFNLETFARAGVPAEKLRLLQPGIDPAPFLVRAPPLAIEGRKGFTFLSVFQWTRRKGWDVLLDAYLRAFSSADDVTLVIRAYPGERKDPPIADRIRRHLRSRGIDPRSAPPIISIDRFIPDEEMPSLYAAADAYVLPTRGEGWGVPFMEAMACGLPVIATRWSGQLDFMNDANSYLIDVDELEAVHPEMTAEMPFYEPDHRWAAPSVDRTAALMREVFDHRDAARARGIRARENILRDWSPARSVAQFREIAGDLLPRLRRRRAASAAPSLLAGIPITWRGPLEDPSGYADEGRQFVLGLDDLGTAVETRPVRWSARVASLAKEDRHRLQNLRSAGLVGEDFVLVQHLFPPHFEPSEQALANIGRTMFETDRIPESWIAPCNLMDQIWVPSAFNVESFAASGVDRSRLRIVPGALDAAALRRRPVPAFVEGRRGFMFLAVFDWSLRKGWDVLLRAWARAFRAEADVTLVLKIWSSAGRKRRDIEDEIASFLERELGTSLTDLAPIRFDFRDYSMEEFHQLHAAADAYVMPSRGEGWGRPAMEAMALGVPVIATSIGGQTAFLSPENSWLIDATLVEVPPAAIREVPSFAGHRWAEPAMEHLAELLARVVADRGRALSKAAAARDEVLARLDRRVVAKGILELVTELAGTRVATTGTHV